MHLNKLECRGKQTCVFASLNCDDFGSHLKKMFCELMAFWKVCSFTVYIHSILGRGSFCFNYCLNSAWHGGDQFVALLRWYGSPGFFDSGL